MNIRQSFTFGRDQLEELKSDAAQGAAERLRLTMKRLMAFESRLQPLTDGQFDYVKRLSELDRHIESPELKDSDGLSDYDRKSRARERYDLTEQRIALKEQLDIITSERNDVFEQIRVMKNRYGACDRTLKQARIIQAALRFAAPSQCELTNASSVVAAIADTRARLYKIASESKQIDQALLPSQHVKEAVDNHLRVLAQRPALGEVMEGTSGAFYLPAIEIPNVGYIRDVGGMIVHLLMDQLREKIFALVDEEYADVHGELILSPEERSDRLSKLAAQKLAIEREDEALCWRGIELGMQIGTEKGQITLRADSDPRAILGLADDPIGPKGSAPQKPPKVQEIKLQVPAAFNTGPSEFVSERPSLTGIRG